MSNQRTHSNSGTDVALLGGAILLVIVGAAAYFVLKGWAESLGVEISSLVFFIIGCVVVVAGITAIILFDFIKRIVLPWLSFPFFGLFWLPALTDWATPHFGPFANTSSESVAWFGSWWGQLLIIAVLAGVAFALMKWLEANDQ